MKKYFFISFFTVLLLIPGISQAESIEVNNSCSFTSGGSYFYNTPESRNFGSTFAIHQDVHVTRLRVYLTPPVSNCQAFLYDLDEDGYLNAPIASSMNDSGDTNIEGYYDFNFNTFAFSLPFEDIHPGKIPHTYAWKLNCVIGSGESLSLAMCNSASFSGGQFIDNQVVTTPFDNSHDHNFVLYVDEDQPVPPTPSNHVFSEATTSALLMATSVKDNVFGFISETKGTLIGMGLVIVVISLIWGIFGKTTLPGSKY